MKNITVIGAGLAGLYAAKTAAIHGAKVTVIERKSGVGTVLKCGEMFTTIYGMPPAKCITREINEWIFDFGLVGGLKYKPQISIALPEGFAVMTDRATHEKIIYEECLKLGVEFIFGRTAMADDLKGSANILATGSSLWNRRAIANCFTVECEDFGDKNIDYAYFKMTPGMKGYYWAFPKTDTEMNIGFGCDDTSADRFFRADYNKTITTICDTSDRFVVRGTVIKPIKTKTSGGGKIPINIDYRNRANYVANYGKDTLYVGDRAGLVNPMLMGGEHLAMLSGQLAGYICANRNDCVAIREVYYTAITQIIAPEMETGIMANNMREILNPDEFYDFMSSIERVDSNPYNDFMLKYIKRTMSKHMKVPDVSNDELKELL